MHGPQFEFPYDAAHHLHADEGVQGAPHILVLSEQRLESGLAALTAASRARTEASEYDGRRSMPAVRPRVVASGGSATVRSSIPRMLSFSASTAAP